MIYEKDFEIEKIEQDLILEAIYQKYGYDFRRYSKAHIRRRLLHRVALNSLNTISELQNLILHDVNEFDKLLLDLSINVTEMFRDPNFYIAVRNIIVPFLRTYPFIKIWHAGCASGEEVYSMQILLEEEGLLDRVQLYATDFNQMILEQAREGLYESDLLAIYEENYRRAGGKFQLSKYYEKEFHRFRINKKFRENIVFADHNLVTDKVFSEVQLIICRNVLIYFDKDLQNMVLKLFSDSLSSLGFLCLGIKENIRFSANKDDFVAISEEQKIFKKK